MIRRTHDNVLTQNPSPLCCMQRHITIIQSGLSPCVRVSVTRVCSSFGDETGSSFFAQGSRRTVTTPSNAKYLSA